jgi:hypothetical protein
MMERKRRARWSKSTSVAALATVTVLVRVGEASA